MLQYIYFFKVCNYFPLLDGAVARCRTGALACAEPDRSGQLMCFLCVRVCTKFVSMRMGVLGASGAHRGCVVLFHCVCVFFSFIIYVPKTDDDVAATRMALAACARGSCSKPPCSFCRMGSRHVQRGGGARWDGKGLSPRSPNVGFF